MKIGVIVIIVSLFAFGPTQASAEPVTFVFEMPFFIDGSVDFVGQASTLEIEVDNGGSSIVNQTYFNTQVTGLAVTVGAQFVALNVIDNMSIFEGFLPYITTDSRGTPTLDLSAFENSAAFLSNGEDFIQIGTAGDNGPTVYHVDIGDSFGISALVVSVPGTGPGVPVVVSNRRSGSGALSLFWIGLLGLCVAVRKTVLFRY